MNESYRGSRCLLVSAAVLALAACDAPSPTVPSLLTPGEALVAKVPSLSPSVTLTVGDTLNAAANSRLAKWAAGEAQLMSWTTSAASVADVSSSGRISAHKVGSATVVLSVSKWRDSIPVIVISGNVASVSVSTTDSSLSSGQTTQLTAVAKDNNGATIPNLTFTYASSHTAKFTVSATGLVTAQTPGSATLSATTGGITGTVTLTVTNGPPAPPPPPTPVALPSQPQLLSFTYPRVVGKSWVLKAGDSFQTALYQAQRGDEIVLPAGVTFTGNFTLPAKPGNASSGWILIRSDKSAQLPPQGSRVTPSHANLMPKLVSHNVAPALATLASASGWWLSGVEISAVHQPVYIHYGLVTLGETSSQNSLALVPSDLVLDRTYIHGSPTLKLMRCVALNAARTAIQDSYFADCHVKGFDSQAIMGWNGPGPFKIVNNTLMGAGENIMFGGADPSISNLIPSDIEIRRNYIYTPASWRGAWTKKNLFELKNAQRLLIEGNVFDGSWSDGQTGFAVVLKVANQGGSCNWCTTRDVTFRNNIIRNAAGGFSIQGQQGGSPHKIGALLARVLIEQNILENINVSPFVGEARMISIMQNVQDLTIRSNTMTAPNALTSYLNLAGNPAGTNFAFQNNIMSYGNYGFFSSWYGVGEASLKGFRGTATFQNIVMIGPQKNGYPNGQFVSSLASAIATGMGANMGSVAAATQGVIVP